MYGAGWSSNNNYIFATDELPVTQVAGYTNTGTLLYESFEGLKAEVITQL
jgi:endoglucanase Acf2